MDTHPAHLQVAIIGAGFAGIGMAVELLACGITDFTVFEKSDRLGGVWRDNTYPGCVCDVPAHLYSYSFAPYQGTTRRYPGQPYTLAYLDHVTETHGLTPHLRLGTEITDARYDEHTATWHLRTGTGEEFTAQVVVFAVGMLHRPAMPTIPGLDSFDGPVAHTARWNSGIDPAGRSVAVIGTGASAVQLVPRLAVAAARVSVFQRTPTWVLPKPGRDFDPVTRRLLEHLPGAHRLYRALVGWAAETVLWPVMVRGWSARPLEALGRAHLRRQVGDRALRRALSPAHPIGTKRILLSNDYLPALARENVDLVTAPITSIDHSAVHTADGGRYPVDVIVCATGFRATEFLAPIRITGRGGLDLHQRWAGRPEAYLGTAVPGFPNMFLIAGPATFNPAGSNIAIKESQIRMISTVLRWRNRIGATAIEPTPQAMTTYRADMRHALARTIWPTGGPSWFRTTDGTVVAPWPGTARSFDRATRRHPATVFAPAPPPATTTTTATATGAGSERRTV